MAEAFAWDDALVCLATYATLGYAGRMEQFDTAEISLKKAGAMHVGDLLYHSDLPSADILDMHVIALARKFITMLRKHYIVEYRPHCSKATLLAELRGVFSDAGKTIKDIAETVHRNVVLSEQPVEGGGQ